MECIEQIKFVLFIFVAPQENLLDEFGVKKTLKMYKFNKENWLMISVQYEEMKRCRTIVFAHAMSLKG